MDHIEEKLNSLLGDPGAMQTIMELAQKLSGGVREENDAPKNTDAPTDFDPELLSKMMPFLIELRGKSGNACQLLYALAPYLSDHKRENIPRAVKLAHVIHVARKFLSEGGWELV